MVRVGPYLAVLRANPALCSGFTPGDTQGGTRIMLELVLHKKSCISRVIRKKCILKTPNIL